MSRQTYQRAVWHVLLRIPVIGALVIAILLGVAGTLAAFLIEAHRAPPSLVAETSTMEALERGPAVAP